MTVLARKYVSIFLAYLGTVYIVGGRRGVENGQAGGEFGFFPQRGGEAIFASGGGKGTVKLLYKTSKTDTFCKKFNFFLKICNFAFLRQIFGDFYLYQGKFFF